MVFQGYLGGKMKLERIILALAVVLSLGGATVHADDAMDEGSDTSMTEEHTGHDEAFTDTDEAAMPEEMPAQKADAKKDKDKTVAKKTKKTTKKTKKNKG